MDTKLLDILACPITKGPLKLSADKTELISKGAGLAYPIRDGIPVMLETEARTLTDDERLALEHFPAGQAVHAVAGIGNPQRFFKTLEGLHWRPVAHAFADHAEFSAKALTFSPSLPVVMTEKDAVKCREFAAADWWYLAVDAQPSPRFIGWLDQRLTGLLP